MQIIFDYAYLFLMTNTLLVLVQVYCVYFKNHTVRKIVLFKWLTKTFEHVNLFQVVDSSVSHRFRSKVKMKRFLISSLLF